MANKVSLPIELIAEDLKGYQEALDKYGEDFQETMTKALNNALKLAGIGAKINAEVSSNNASTSTSSGFWATSAQAANTVLPAVTKISNVLQSGLNTVIGTVQDIYNRLKQSSPLLQTIESLFNLAVQLFFMPLGNKLATVLLPAVLELVDGVMEIWDKFEGKSLGEMFTIAISEGARLFGEYIANIGTLLKEEGGVVGSIGSTLVVLGNLISSKGAEIINGIAKLLEFIMQNLPGIITALVGFKAVTVAMLTAIIINTAMTAGAASIWTLGGAAVAGAVTAGVASAAISNMFGTETDISGHANGGYIPPTPGGKIIRVAEGGEGEYIIPESKRLATGGNTYNITINGMTNDELKTYITDIVNDRTNEYRLRSGF
jgi:hypothetical protein